MAEVIERFWTDEYRRGYQDGLEAAARLLDNRGDKSLPFGQRYCTEARQHAAALRAMKEPED